MTTSMKPSRQRLLFDFRSLFEYRFQMKKRADTSNNRYREILRTLDKKLNAHASAEGMQWHVITLTFIHSDNRAIFAPDPALDAPIALIFLLYFLPSTVVLFPREGKQKR